MTKKIIYFILLVAVFAYGFSIGFFKIFPFSQLLAAKHYIEHSAGTFEIEHQNNPSGSAVTVPTFLGKLLVKKIHIPGFSGHGGGISTSGDYLYIITNKGSVNVIDLTKKIIVKSTISDIPMNFSELIRSGHPYKNDFRIQWFRVSGVYSEIVNQGTHKLFVSHHTYDSNRDCITHNISRLELAFDNRSVTQKSTWETIFTASPCIKPEPDNLLSVTPYPGHISGGAISGYDEQNILVSIGDYDRHGINGTDEYAMDLSKPYGKFILVDKESGNWSIYTIGNRNASGLYIDQDSVVWSVENGPSGGDELNILVEGENYGWPKVSLGLWYDPVLELPGAHPAGTHPGYKKPVFSWVPSVAPSSLLKIESDKFKYWTGDLIMGTMRDQSLHRLRLDQDNRVIYNERIFIGHRIRDLTTLPDGKLAMVTDDGYLLIVDDGGPVFQDNDSVTKERMTALDSWNDDVFGFYEKKSEVSIKSPETIFQQNCMTCHSLNRTNQIGPHLYDLFSRDIGGTDYANYSQTLKTDGRRWNKQLFRSFMENPEGEFPGTRMQKINLTSSEVDSLIHLFHNQRIRK